MGTISSNGFSHDQQVMDALNPLELMHPDAYDKVIEMFPEEPILDGAHFDTDAMGVDCEWGSWLTDAIEATGLVVWEEGEPWTAPTTRLLQATVTMDVTEAWECWRIEVTTDQPEDKITPEWLSANSDAWEFIDLKDRGYTASTVAMVDEVWE